jgi:uncharacterized protein with PIN domain
MFNDATTLVAIRMREPEVDAFTDLIEAAPSPITSR